MNKPSIRQGILNRSVQRLLDDGERVRATVVMTTRHPLFLPYSVAAGAVLFLVATASGFEPLSTRILLAGCGLAIAAIATTDQWILAETTQGLVLLRSSRVRQKAVEVARRLDDEVEIQMVANTVINSEWRIDGTTYGLTKRWESTMRHLSTQS